MTDPTASPTPTCDLDGRVIIEAVIMRGAVPNWRATAEDLGAQLLDVQDDLRQSRSMHKEAVRVMTSATEECNQFHRVQRVRYDRAYAISTRWYYIFLPKSVRLLLSDLMDPT